MTALLRSAAFDDHSFLSPENTQKFLSQNPGGLAIIGITWRRSPLHPARSVRIQFLNACHYPERDIGHSQCLWTLWQGWHPFSHSQRGLPISNAVLNWIGRFRVHTFFISFQSHAWKFFSNALFLYTFVDVYYTYHSNLFKHISNNILFVTTDGR